MARSLLCSLLLSSAAVNAFISPVQHTQRTSFSSHIHSTAAPPNTDTETTSSADSSNLESSYDVIIVGSGIGGLSAAALLSHYGYSVAVLESHYAPGGAAHGYSVYNKDLNNGEGGTFTFDTGPSFFSGLNSNYPAKASNPLRSLLDIIDEQVDCIPYTTFGLKFPNGDFVHSPKFGLAEGVIDQVSGKSGVRQWNDLMKSMEPLVRLTVIFQFL